MAEPTSSSLEAIHSELQANPERWSPYLTSSFKFDVDSYGKRISETEKWQWINDFAYSGLLGDIKMKNPEFIFAIRVDVLAGMRFYFGRVVGESQRDLMDRFDLKKRSYLGTTSFEAELSLVMSNIGKVGPGSLVLDPFVGTGSFLYTTSAFGAYSIGSDIDGRQLRGTSKDTNFYNNQEQYVVERLVLGGLVQDIKHHAFRPGLLFDAILTDPPYGVRAGAKKIGGFDSSKPNRIPTDKAVRICRYPKTIPYEMEDLVADLFDFAAKFLRPEGRLLFWFPVERDEVFDPAKDMPRDARFRPIADCLQKCREFDRWLIVAELKGQQ